MLALAKAHSVVAAQRARLSGVLAITAAMLLPAIASATLVPRSVFIEEFGFRS